MNALHAHPDLKHCFEHQDRHCVTQHFDACNLIADMSLGFCFTSKLARYPSEECCQRCWTATWPIPTDLAPQWTDTNEQCLSCTAGTCVQQRKGSVNALQSTTDPRFKQHAVFTGCSALVYSLCSAFSINQADLDFCEGLAANCLEADLVASNCNTNDKLYARILRYPCKFLVKLTLCFLESTCLCLFLYKHNRRLSIGGIWSQQWVTAIIALCCVGKIWT